MGKVPAWLWPLITIVLSIGIAYGTVEASTKAMNKRLSKIERWQEFTDSNRFTDADFSLWRTNHEKVPHGNVPSRLTALETIVDRTAQDYKEIKDELKEINKRLDQQ